MVCHFIIVIFSWRLLPPQPAPSILRIQSGLLLFKPAACIILYYPRLSRGLSGKGITARLLRGWFVTKRNLDLSYWRTRSDRGNLFDKVTIPEQPMVKEISSIPKFSS